MVDFIAVPDNKLVESELHRCRYVINGVKVFSMGSLCFRQIAPVIGSRRDLSKTCLGKRALQDLYLFFKQLLNEQVADKRNVDYFTKRGKKADKRHFPAFYSIHAKDPSDSEEDYAKVVDELPRWAKLHDKIKLD